MSMDEQLPRPDFQLGVCCLLFPSLVSFIFVPASVFFCLPSGTLFSFVAQRISTITLSITVLWVEPPCFVQRHARR